LAVNLQEQLIPGTFKYTLDKILDKIDLKGFDGKYRNDETGAAAIEPRVLLKIILYCYSLGVISSRKIVRMCEINLVAKALSGDTVPHCTTISNFISRMGEEAGRIFSEVLAVCHQLGLIGGKTFAKEGEGKGEGTESPGGAADRISGKPREADRGRRGRSQIECRGAKVHTSIDKNKTKNEY
jgi:transposase